MFNRSLDLKNSSFTFSDYCKLNIDLDELLSEFDFSLTKESIFTNIQTHHNIENLKLDLELILNNLEFSNEIMVREFLISPILIFMLKNKTFKLKSEKSLYFDERLRGVIDYYIEKTSHFAIIEAKAQDLNAGFKQLSIELITLHKLIENSEKKIFGAVTIGTDWIFAKVDRIEQKIIKDIKIVRVPEEIDKLIGILDYIIGE